MEDSRFTLRLPADLNEELIKSADRHERSKNAHIVWILRSFLSQEGRRVNLADERWGATNGK